MANFSSGTAGLYSASLTLTKQANTIDIPTKGKYADRDIKVILTSQTATAAANTASAEASLYTTDGSNAGVNIASVVGTKVTTEPTSGYYIAVSAVGSGSSKITKAGWINTGNLTAATSSAAIRYFPVAGAVKSNAAIGAATITSPIFTYDSDNTRFNLTGSADITGTATLTVASAGYLPKENVTGNTTGTANLNATVARVGVGATVTNASVVTPTVTATGASNVIRSSVATSKPSSGYYVVIQSAKSTKTLTVAPKVTSEGYGTTDYYASTTTTATIGANASALRYVVLPTGAVSLSAPGSATITDVTYTYDTDATTFKVAGSSVISGTATGTVTEGYIKGNVTASLSGNATIDATLARIGVKATLGGATTARKPTISRTTTSATGATNVGSAAATTTAPTSGFFVSVQSAANTAAITATASVISNGYGTTATGQYVPTNQSATVGAAASDITYIPITAGSVSVSNATITAAPTISVCATNGVIRASYGKTTTINPVVSAGWVTSGTGGTITTTGTNTSSLTTQAATTFNVSTSNQFIKSGVFLTGTATFRGVTTSNIDAANIKTGVTVQVGDSASATRIKGVTGNFTAASTITTGTAATSAQILSGYGAWVDGVEVQGNIATRSEVNVTVNSATATVAAGYYPSEVKKAIQAGSAKTPAKTIAKAPSFSLVTATGKVTASYNSSLSVTPEVTAGWVSAGTAGTISTTGSATLTLPVATVTTGTNVVTITPGWVKAQTSYNLATTKVTTGTSSVSSNNAIIARGTASWGNGWITQGSIAAATFANTSTSGVTYVDISNTNAAPILTSGGNLYINAGYTDNLIISLAKLIPDGATVNSSAQILNGVTAYDGNGTLWTGNIPTKTGADLSVSGKTVYTPPGYYAATASKAVADGAYSAGITLSAVTVTPSVSITNASTYGFTTTQPSSGSYITVDPGANTPSYSATATATISTAGYIATGNKKTGTSATVKVAAGTNYYAPVVTPTFAGAGLTTTSSNTIIVTGMTTATTSSYYIDASATITATVATATYTVNAGVVTTAATAKAINGSTTAVTKAAARVYIPAATVTSTGGALSKVDKTGTQTVSIGSGGSTNMSNITIENNATTATYPYIFRVYATATGGTVYPTASRTAVSETRTAGYLPARAATNIIAAATVTATATISAANAGTSYYVKLKKATYTTTVAGGAISCTSSGSTNATISTTDSYNSGVEVKFTGTRAAITATTTANGAGYMPVGLASQGSLAVATSTAATYYIQGVTLTTPSSGTRKFDVTVPNGDSTITFQFSVDSDGNVTVAGPD